MIKKFFNRWFRNVLAVIVLSYFYSGFEAGTDLVVIGWAAIVLALIQIFLQPLIKVLFIPINVVTLGMFKFLTLTVHLLIVVYIFEPLRFSAFDYNAINLRFLEIPAGHINILFSVILGTVFYRFLRKVVIYLT